PHPARTHADTLASDTPLVLVDQFEELFTLCTDPDERARFLDLLFDGSRRRVVIAVRADFYGHLTRHPRLAEAAQDATLLVAPMGPDELRETIVRPAALGGLVVERTLTARLLDDVADEPGALPLMSHALLETWRRRRGRTLTEAAYEAAGGIHGAIARTAEELYAGLTPAQAVTARRILLRLVTPGQGTPDTRRPADRAELTAGEGESSAETHDADADADTGTGTDTDLVLERLARARLITLDHGTVDLAHEALLTAWPRLRTWIDEDRERLRAQRHLTEAAHTWALLHRDPDSLYRGVRLAGAEEHFARNARELTPLEREFLDRSTGARHRERRRTRTRYTLLCVLVALSLVAGLVAWQQNRSSEQRHTEAEARRIAGVAESLRMSDPVTSMRLSLAAWRVADLPETRSALSAAAAQHEQHVFTDPDRGKQTMRRLSADGRTLLSLGADRVTRWDVDAERRTARLPGLGATLPQAGFPRTDADWLPVFEGTAIAVHDLTTGRTGAPLTDADGGAEMSPSGRTLVVYDGTRIQLWDARPRKRLLEIENPGSLSEAGTPWARLMAVRKQLERERRATVLTGEGMPDATVSPDDRYLALCVPGRRLQLWDVAGQRQITAPWLPEVSVGTCLQEQITFSPDGTLLGVIDATGFRAWRIDTGRQVAAVEYTNLKLARFSADGTFVAASDGDEILVWRLITPVFPVFRHRLSGEVVKEIRLDDRTLRYLGGAEGVWGPTVHTVTLGRSTTSDWDTTPTYAARFSPDGTTLATVRPDPDRRHLRFRLLDARTGRRLADLGRLPCELPPNDPPPTHCTLTLSFDSTGRTLAYGVAHYVTARTPERVRLYDIQDRRVTTTLTPDDLGPAPLAHIAFGPDDRSLLLTEEPVPDTAATRVWDLARRTTTATLSGTSGGTLPHPDGDLLVTTGGEAYRLPAGTRLPSTGLPGGGTAMAFSPDGAYFAVGDGSGRVELWDGRLKGRLGVLADPDTTTYQYVSAVAFSPDGRTLAVVGDEGTLHLWDVASRRRVGAPLPTPGDTVAALAFSPDGTLLYAAGDHTPVQTYEITPEAAADTVCRRVRDGLSPEEWHRQLPDVPYRETCASTSAARTNATR
ncbi:WD40 repeat domain-containing protein, partial [Streptomyces sp. S3(2020)]|uniref:WD40 repeat domain-containing protein n=1 Tax=Streptomyces sp. S3(2020) TaxID=2732044 RepID=UPI001489E453